MGLAKSLNLRLIIFENFAMLKGLSRTYEYSINKTKSIRVKYTLSFKILGVFYTLPHYIQNLIFCLLNLLKK